MIAGFPAAMSAQVASTSEPTPSTEIALRLEHIFAATPEKIFRMWLEPEKIKKWFVYDVEAHWSPDPEVDAKPGGSFRWSVVRDSDRAAFRFHGTYRQIKTPDRLAFTWEWESLPIAGVDGPGSTVVSVEFVRHGPETKIVLTQAGFPNEAAREAHQKGWERCLTGMTSLLAPNDPQVVKPESEYIRVKSAVIALEHLRVIDGTGAKPKPDQIILLADDKIITMGAVGFVQIRACICAGRRSLDGGP
jgi:uncharacterized protein YndB with AHSA1/START domain